MAALRRAHRGQLGKIASLIDLLRRHGPAIEADLRRFYTVDLCDLGTARLTWRRLWVLLESLPPESAFVRKLAGVAATWSTTDYLLAHLIDIEMVANWQRAGRKNSPRPKPFPRPDADRRGTTRYGTKGRPMTRAQYDRLRARWAQHRPGRVEKAQTIT